MYYAAKNNITEPCTAAAHCTDELSSFETLTFLLFVNSKSNGGNDDENKKSNDYSNDWSCCVRGIICSVENTEDKMCKLSRLEEKMSILWWISINNIMVRGVDYTT